MLGLSKAVFYTPRGMHAPKADPRSPYCKADWVSFTAQ